MGLLKLFNAIDTKLFYQTHVSTEVYRAPFFASGDQDTIEYTLLTRNPDGGFLVPWRRENPASYSLRIALYTSDGATELASATVWADDQTNNKKTGKLVQIGGAITSALGSALSVACIFEGEVEDAAGNRTTVFQESVELKKGLITAATVEVPPAEVAATQRWTKGLFVPTVRPAGFMEEFVTPSGTRMIGYVGDDRQWHFDDLS